MKKVQKRILIAIVFVLLTSFFTVKLLAKDADNTNKITLKEFSDEYIEYMKLSDEAKKLTYAPRVFKSEDNSFEIPENEIKVMRMVGSVSPATYSLRSVVPENLKIKDQKTTLMCWTFASLSSLETNLALSDYYNERAKKVYDFSERHMEYATVRILNGETNIYGFNRNIDSGAKSLYKHDIAYLTNGSGAINESEMPFSLDMSMKDLSYIQNKTVVTQVYDTVDFPACKASTVTEELKDKMKNHIKNNGSINVNIYSDTSLGKSPIVTNDGKEHYSYNNATGAIYCDEASAGTAYKNEAGVTLGLWAINHAVSIIGWDDNYAISNFHPKNQPSEKGAWIIRNSYGEATYTLDEMKEYVYYIYKKIPGGENFLSDNNYTSPDVMPTDMVKNLFTQMGWTINADNSATIKMGDNGIMYVSYQDCNVYSYMTGIEKAENKVSYDNLYQYDELGSTSELYMENTDTMWMGNIFSKKTGGTEYLTQVSVYVPKKTTCKVWVNANGSSKKRADMVQVKLKEGDYEVLEPGYHTLEFASPLEIKATSFFVALEMTQENSEKFSFCMEGLWKNAGDVPWNCVQLESGKCFIASDIDNNEWMDMSTIQLPNKYGGTIDGGDSIIKAFTTNTNNDDSLKEIKITKAPNKISYFEGENFDKTGMVVMAYLNNGESNEITEYTVINGNDLSAGQASVTISYEGKTVDQAVTVMKNSVQSLKIVTPPSKTAYKAGENFDKTGMVVQVIYANGDVKTISDYEITDGIDLKNGQSTVTISYNGKTVTQSITVTTNEITKIEIVTPPTKTTYVEGQDFDKTGMVVKITYEDGTEKNVTSYSIINGVKLTKGQTSVTIKYEDKTVEQNITVQSKSAISIVVKNKPNKVSYIVNTEDLVLEGGVITVKYNDGSSEDVLMTSPNVIVDGFDNSKTGTINLTVKYLNLSTNFEVTINEKVQELPENSDFSRANAINKIIKIYYTSNDNSKDYAIITVDISGIQKATVNDSLSYSYYLSSDQAVNVINESDWVKIDGAQINNGKLSITINTKDLPNYDEVSRSDKLYLYIKETAIRNGQTKILVTNSMDISKAEQKEEYVDGIKKENQNGSGNTDGSGSTGNDNTTANGKYPYTGRIIVGVMVLIIIGFGMVGFVKYRTIDK